MDSSRSSKSSYISDVTDHGSGSGTGHNPAQIANKWLSEKFGRKTEIPFPRNAYKENGKKEIRCSATDQLVCIAKFPDSLSRSNIVQILAHLYQFHSSVYTSITDNYDTWCQTKQKITPSPEEVLTTQGFVRFFENVAKKETKLSSSSLTIRKRISTKREPSVCG